MKSLLIIIPGAKNKKSPFFDPILQKFYRYFGVDVGEDDRAEELNSIYKAKISMLRFSIDRVE